MKPKISAKLLIAECRTKLMGHQIYQFIDNKPKMTLFMERHVWAVWDFMILLKQLQRRLTCTNKIWLPVKNTSAARFINEIVVGEQTDQLPSGKGYISHAQLYLQAMAQIGACSLQIQRFWGKMRQGESFESAIIKANIPNYVKTFVRNTFESIQQPTAYVAAQFFYGREDPIPEMFQKFVNTLQKNNKCDYLIYYLQRHIELDQGQHGSIAQKIINELKNESDDAEQKVDDGALNAIQHRIKLWDGILEQLKHERL